jgi:outer membrane protein TolC
MIAQSFLPYRWAPQNNNREWVAHKRDQRLPFHEATTMLANKVIAPEQEYDLPTLIDFSLTDNPETRRVWSTARSAAAEYGSAQAAYYPHTAFVSEMAISGPH